MTQDLHARFALDHGSFRLQVDLTLPARGVSVLFGHSGSGKTTLLRCIAGLEKAHGELTFAGDVWQDSRHFVPTWRRSLSYVFQESSLFDHLTAAGNLQFAIRRSRARVEKKESDDIIGLLGIGHTLHKLPHQLSGGERQRVAIARALLSKPRLLLMDEPLASLDEQRKQEILPYLEELKSHFDLPIIYVTHSPAEVARLADYLVAMKDGQAVASGTLNDTLSRMDFPLRLGEDAGVVIEGTVMEKDSRWHLDRIGFNGGQSIWLRDSGHACGTAVRVRILARDVSLALNPAEDSSIQNHLPARVSAVGSDEHPGLALVKVMVGDTPLLARMTQRSAERLQLTPGQTLWVQVKSAALV
ncbi:MAG: molybdenum ABC transporter ATP-binding protein [Pseudomonadota bacterium]|nr:molybdenum ABC transporter ATP-binding protein [Pseudomonadota bacterium]